MKLWIDDVRDPPNEDWVHAKNSAAAIDFLCAFDPILRSFDHDLGGEDTSMAVINLIEIWANNKLIPKFEWQVHSMNPVGRENIIRAMNKIEKLWNDIPA